MATKQASKPDNYELHLKVSPKGAVQLDGLRRFPVTLYADEWEAVLARKDKILAFIAANSKILKTKEDSVKEKGGVAI